MWRLTKQTSYLLYLRAKWESNCLLRAQFISVSDIHDDKAGKGRHSDWMFKTGGITSCHIGGIGRLILPPHKTIRRITTNLKTKNNQDCHKIKLYESPTTKGLKKKHSSRQVEGAKRMQYGAARWWQVARQLQWWPAEQWSHINVQQIKTRRDN